MTRIRKLAIAASSVAVTALAIACSGHGAGHETTTPTTPPVTGTSTPTPPPTPTPTPSGPIYLDNLYTADGTAKTTMGKCLGFTVVGNGVTFAPDATVKMSGFGTVPVKFVDSTHLRVGDPATSSACFFTPIFGTAGTQDVEVDSSTGTWTISSAIEIDPMQVFDLGTMNIERVWTSTAFGSGAASAGVNVFEKPYDVDIYTANFVDVPRMYPHIDFFDRSGTGIVPLLEFWNQADAIKTGQPENRGALSNIFPMQEQVYFAVRDVNGQGGTGATYDLSIIQMPIGDTPNGTGSTCANAPEITPGNYHIGDLNLSNNYDPMKNDGCRDTLFGDPIDGHNIDGTWTVTVPAGKELRVTNYDNHWTAALYLRPITSGCDPMPADCLKAASHFGGGDNNTIVYDNTSGADERFYLTWDGNWLNESKTPDDHAFLLNVELFDLP